MSAEVSMETMSPGVATEGELEADRTQRDRVHREQMGEVIMDLNRALVRAIRRRQAEVEMS